MLDSAWLASRFKPDFRSLTKHQAKPSLKSEEPSQAKPLIGRQTPRPSRTKPSFHFINSKISTGFELFHDLNGENVIFLYILDPYKRKLHSANENYRKYEVPSQVKPFSVVLNRYQAQAKP